MILKSQLIKKINRYLLKSNWDFGSTLKAQRVKVGCSAEELARYLGVKTNQIFRYENNHQGMSIDKLRKTSFFLRMNPFDLLGIECVDARENPENGMVYDWELDGDYKLVWICIRCKQVNIVYGKDNIILFHKKKLQVECENNMCKSFYHRFWDIKNERPF